MNWHTPGSRWALLGFLSACVLVLGGLGWVTRVAFALERDQARAQSEAALHRRIDLAMWRLENLVAPVRAAEAARPLEHYKAFFSPTVSLNPDGTHYRPQSVLQPSPLLTAELPEWELLHFHISDQTGWSSPQVIQSDAAKWAERSGIGPRFESRNRNLLEQLANDVAPETLIDRLGGGRRIPDDLKGYFSPAEIAAIHARDDFPKSQSVATSLQSSAQTSAAQWQIDSQREQALRQNQQVSIQNWVQGDNQTPAARSLEVFFCPSDLHKEVRGISCDACRVALPGLPPMVPLWLPSTSGEQRLAFVRPIPTHAGLEVQGVLLDWPRLRELLSAEVSDLFPDATIEPDPQPQQREPTAMCNLPVRLNPGSPPEAAVRGWTSVRAGLALAWLAAAVALTAAAWGGWTLLELSERRQRFVSAVTHELRTPLTTLRLYLDMLANGMVRDEAQRAEYLRTLCAESDRLAGLIGNVLDFSRLENGRPEVTIAPVELTAFLDQTKQLLEPRCVATGKTLIVENQTLPGTTARTDVELLRQILSNLVDNACKHTAGAADSRMWLRACSLGNLTVRLEVEDRGPGIPSQDRRSIFRSFWRGRRNDVHSVSGFGLGLALAHRWAKLIGGSLRLESPANQPGARFVLEVPAKHVAATSTQSHALASESAKV